MTTNAQYLAVARGLLARESAAQANGAADTAVVGEVVLQRLHEHLARWLGNEGSQTVSARALAYSRASHPILSSVRLESRDGSIRLAALAASPTEERSDAVIALIAAILGLLARLIGDDLLGRLLHQAWPSDVPNDMRFGSPDDTRVPNSD